MCDRYSISAALPKLEERYKLEATGLFQPIYNAHPATLLPVVLNQAPKSIQMCYWGLLPQFANQKKLSNKLFLTDINSLTKPSYQKILSTSRCLIPADGLYIWKQSSKKSKIPYRVHLVENDIFSMAGYWEVFQDENTGDSVRTFSLITTNVESPIDGTPIIMPVLINKHLEQEWLSDQAISSPTNLLNQPTPNVWQYYPVNSNMLLANYDDKEVLLKTTPTDQLGNYTLFD